jgi:hypothetical protein
MNRDYLFAIAGLLLVIFAGSIVAAAESAGYLAVFTACAGIFALVLLFREVS